VNLTKEKTLNNLLNNLKRNKMTAVEWLLANLISEPISEADFENNINCWNEAEEIEKKQKEEFAIGFAEWCIKKRIDFFDDTEIGRTYTIDGFVSRYKMNELLEMFKKEKGL
jgi:hypothetical protein